jgi:hypothetical protein
MMPRRAPTAYIYHRAGVTVPTISNESGFGARRRSTGLAMHQDPPTEDSKRRA